MISSLALKGVVAEARPIIERQLDDAERIAAFREVVTAQGGDWSSLKALIKAQIQDERDEGKRVEKILAKAEFATGYADLLGWSKMNENNFSAEDEFDPITGGFVEADEGEAAGNASDLPTTSKPEQPHEGRDHEEVAQPQYAATHQAGSQFSTSRPADHPILLLRPHCRHPGEEVCGGSGKNHCQKCLAAMREREAA